jgi:hypothetical protein
MIPTPLAFEEVAQKVGFAQATHLGHAEFGKAPERFNTVHMVFPTSELIFMIMNPMMAVTIEDQAIVRSPAVRVHRAISQNLIFNDGPQRVTRAVIDNFDVHTTPSFQQSYDRNLATSATSTFAAYSPSSEIAFTYLNLPSEGLTLSSVNWTTLARNLP